MTREELFLRMKTAVGRSEGIFQAHAILIAHHDRLNPLLRWLTGWAFVAAGEAMLEKARSNEDEILQLTDAFYKVDNATTTERSER